MYRRIFVIAVVVLSLLGTTLPAHASVSGVNVTKNCPTGATVTGTATGNFVTVAAVVGGALFGITNQAVTPGQPFTVSVNYSPPLPVGTVVDFQVSDNAGPPNSTVSSTVANCSTGRGGPTFYNPGDPRINGQPGDHEAVYCNPGTLRTGTLAVIPINLDSTGGPEVKFPYLTLIDAYPDEVSKDFGSSGVVRVSMDLDLNFHVRLFGGPFHANGQGDNAKYGSCLSDVVPPLLANLEECQPGLNRHGHMLVSFITPPVKGGSNGRTFYAPTLRICGQPFEQEHGGYTVMMYLVWAPDDGQFYYAYASDVEIVSP